MNVRKRAAILNVCIVINDKSQGSTTTYLNLDGLLRYTFVIQFASKIFF